MTTRLCQLGWVISILTCLATSVASAGCARPEPKTVSLRLNGVQPDASVTVDDMYIGELSLVMRQGLAMPVGKHRITVEKPGYFPWDKVIEVKEGDPLVRLDVVLVALPD